MKAFDIFGEGVSFEYDGKSTHRSYLGSLLSIGIIVITISYAVRRFLVMQDRADTVHLQTPITDLYSKESPLDYETTDFDFAFGLKSNTDFNPVFQDPEGYAKFGVYLREWGVVDGTFKREDKPLGYHRCSAEDANGRFVAKNPIRLLEVQALFCLDDPSELKLYGDP